MAVTVHCPNPGAYVQCAAQAHVAASFSFPEQGHRAWVVPPVLRQILASRFMQVGKPQVEKGCRSERAGGAWGGEGLGWPRHGTGNGS